MQSNILFCSQTANKLECSICYRKEHQWVEFDTLPPAVVKQESVSAGDEEDDLPDCDRCEKSSKKPAVVYCPDCAEKICTMHQKVLHCHSSPQAAEKRSIDESGLHSMPYF